jgi:hypothetical protein
MNYYKILWIILGSVILNTWKDIITFYWFRCTYIGAPDKSVSDRRSRQKDKKK